MGKSPHVLAHVFNCFILFYFIFFNPRICACVFVLKREKQRLWPAHRRTQIVTRLRILMTSSFYWTISRWRLGGEYAAALLIADRSDLRPLHHPRPWLHGVTSSPLFMMMSVWPRNKRVAACSVIREDWNQLLTLTIQHGAVLLVPFKCDACKMKYIGGKKTIIHVSCIDSSCSSLPL